MKKWLGGAFVVTLLVAAPAFTAQNKAKEKTTGSQEQITDTKKSTDAGTTNVKTDTIFGEVKEYKPGKSITISTPGKSEGSRTVDLSGKDLTAHVAPHVKVGEWVKISERTDNNGHKTIRVEPSKHAARTEQ